MPRCEGRDSPEFTPSEEKFTLGDVAAELELEPRRANLLGAFVADGAR
jgi:hypothetical protein